jgi:DNA-binding CsgD family transcriptional regulator
MPLRIALDIADHALADRIAALLAGIDGIELVSPEADHVAAIVAPAESRRPSKGREAALTPRESEVLALLAEGASNKLIARRLGISTHTAKFHVASLLEKLDAVSRTDAVAHAARIGVLDL